MKNGKRMNESRHMTVPEKRNWVRRSNVSIVDMGVISQLFIVTFKESKGNI